MRVSSHTISRSGLTLIEMLVSLIITSLTLVIIAQAITNTRAWSSRISLAKKENEKIAEVYQFVGRMLSEASPFIEATNETKITTFAGSINSVRFVRVESGYPSRAGLYQYLLSVQKSPQGLWSIELERGPLSSSSHFGTIKDPVKLKIYSGKHAPRFSFFDSSVWQDNWKNREGMPLLVRFSIETWPALSISVLQGISPKEHEEPVLQGN